MKPVTTPEARRKAPAPKPKARKESPPSPRNGSAAVAAAQHDPAHEQLVREAAYFVYERSGRVGGRELEHWLLAEAEVLRLAGAAQTQGEAPPSRESATPSARPAAAG